MCRVHKIWYACGCGTTIRLSTCRATKFKYSWNPKTKLSSRKVMCHSKPFIDLTSSNVCGVCLFKPIREAWDMRISEMEERLKIEDSWAPEAAGLETQLAEWKEERDKEEWACKRSFPINRKEGPDCLKEIGEKIIARSPLSREVFPEDIDDFESGWTDCSDDDRPINSPHSTFDDYFMDKYMWMGPYLNLPELLGKVPDDTATLEEDTHVREIDWKIPEHKDMDWGELDFNNDDIAQELIREPLSEAQNFNGPDSWNFEPDEKRRDSVLEERNGDCLGLREIKAELEAIEQKTIIKCGDGPRLLGMNQCGPESDGVVQFWLHI
ncbi:hypothetical protein EJ08DRAFT_659787 [Tothia fuscella]|uniref:Uncharacterized protein n=1 Tax=Tothia fuscella TaxID=1048955 RepID=A0A9P4NTC1_9PEZI|nr:hypothetical protein EJ08DRAFT_659787 [Tothia fuscella]